MLKNGSLVGTAVMPNLTLLIGENTITAQSAFSVRRTSFSSFLSFSQLDFTLQPNNSPEGQEILDNFVGKNGRLTL